MFPRSEGCIFLAGEAQQLKSGQNYRRYSFFFNADENAVAVSAAMTHHNSLYTGWCVLSAITRGGGRGAFGGRDRSPMANRSSLVNAFFHILSILSVSPITNTGGADFTKTCGTSGRAKAPTAAYRVRVSSIDDLLALIPYPLSERPTRNTPHTNWAQENRNNQTQINESNTARARKRRGVVFSFFSRNPPLQ